MDNLKIQKNKTLAAFTTFGIGGVARWFVEVGNEDELCAAVVWAKEKNISYFILAGGSNMLFGDTEFKGLIIKIKLNQWQVVGETLIADAGCNLSEMIAQTSLAGLGGWEKMAGIPGTIGGAARGNAGAFGTEMTDVVASLRALHAPTGEVRKFAHNDCNFAYRDSFFKQNSEWIILTVTVELVSVDRVRSAQIIDETIAEREKRHLQNVAAAGSFFANPVVSIEIQRKFEHDKNTVCRNGRVPAGWLIEEVGLKGKQIGGAQSSEQHPNYIINTGSATAEDVIILTSHIKQRVRDQFGVQLQEEVTIMI